MNALPKNFKLEKDFCWEKFDVNSEFDDSNKRYKFSQIEFSSDVFATYHPGGENLIVEQGRKRRIVIKVNKVGHDAYPTLEEGDGYLVTIYNDDMGTAQMGTKPVRLVSATEKYLVFRGHEVLAMGPFGLVDPGNTDYGFAFFLENEYIKKVALYRFDTKKCYEYASLNNQSVKLPFSLSDKTSTRSNSSTSDSSTDINFDKVKRNADAYKLKEASMNFITKSLNAAKTDRIFNKGVQYWNAGNKATALKYFAEALEAYPINTDVIGIYGDYYEYSNYDLSMKFYELAINLGSLRKKDYYQLANFYKWKGEQGKALICYALWDKVKAKYKLDD